MGRGRELPEARRRMLEDLESTLTERDRAQVLALIGELVRDHAPPLLLRDVVGLSLTAVGHMLLSAHVPRGKPVLHAELDALGTPTLRIVGTLAPRLVTLAGFVPTEASSLEAVGQQFSSRWREWQHEVRHMHQAIVAAGGKYTLDTRGGRLVHIRRAWLNCVMDDRVALLRTMENALRSADRRGYFSGLLHHERKEFQSAMRSPTRRQHEVETQLRILARDAGVGKLMYVDEAGRLRLGETQVRSRLRPSARARFACETAGKGGDLEAESDPEIADQAAADVLDTVAASRDFETLLRALAEYRAARLCEVDPDSAAAVVIHALGDEEVSLAELSRSSGKSMSALWEAREREREHLHKFLKRRGFGA